MLATCPSDPRPVPVLTDVYQTLWRSADETAHELYDLCCVSRTPQTEADWTRFRDRVKELASALDYDCDALGVRLRRETAAALAFTIPGVITADQMEGPTVVGFRHLRRCWDCGNVAEHADSVVPEVLCRQCGSQDTRCARSAAEQQRFEARVKEGTNADA